MKKKERLRVLGQWVVIQHTDLSKAGDGDSALHGDCDSTERVIRIDAKLDGAAYKRVLRHEICHMKLRLSGIAELLSEEQEEALAVLAEAD